MRKFAVVLLALIVASAAFAAGGIEGGIKLGIVNAHPSESGYRAGNVKDLDRVFNAKTGYDVKKVNVNTLNEQIAGARQLITEGVEYLIIAGAANMNGWDSVLNAAKAAGVKVIIGDREINADPSLYEVQILSDMAAEGNNAVEFMRTLNLPVYNIIHIQGQIGSAAQIGRSAGLDAEIRARPNWNLIRRGTGGDTWSGDEAKKVVEAAIAAGESFNFIYAENDGMAEGAMKALQAAGITHGVNGDVKILGFDYNKWALQYVLDGKWNADIECKALWADQAEGYIKLLVSGQPLYLPGNKKVYMKEGYLANPGITKADVEKFGI